MKKLNILLLLMWSLTAFAQNKESNLFCLNVGNFANPESADFAALQKIGLVYAVPLGGNQAQVFVGDFPDKITATTAMNGVKTAFPEIHIAEKKNTLNSIAAIQLASKKVGDKIVWKNFENAGSIYGSSDGKIIRIFSANFGSDSLAKNALANLKALGYKDAVLKNVAEINLHKIGIFEAGIELNGLIKAQILKIDSSKIIVKGATPTPVPNPYLGNYSVSELKRSLSVLGVYKGKIDDKNDASLEKAYEEAKAKDKILAKYVILSKAYKSDNQKVSELQQAINNIVKDPVGANKLLEKSTQPIAKAYRAYLLFTQNGDAVTINKWMKEAVQTAFKGVKENKFSFDPSATYDYKDLSQVIKHIRYIQGVSKDEPAAPNWLFSEHPTEAKAAFTGDFKIEASDPALQIESVKITKLMAEDLVVTAKTDAAEDAKNAQYRTRQLIHPQTVIESQDNWNKQLWESLDKWAAKDALNQQTFNAFKVAYYEATLQLQQQLATSLKSNNETNNRNTALAIMKTIVEKPIKEYIRQK
jgi:hypothetical protein